MNLDFAIEFFLILFYSSIFVFLIGRIPFFTNSGLSTFFLRTIFVFKIIIAIVVWSIYTFYYTDRTTADIYKFFDDSKVIFGALKTNPLDYFRMVFNIADDGSYFQKTYYKQMDYWLLKYGAESYNGTRTIIRLNAILQLFSFGFFNVHSIFASFLSLIGFVGIYRFLVYSLSYTSFFVVACVFFIPTIQFWTSTLLKESIIFFALGVSLFSLSELLKGTKFKATYFILGLFALILILIVKYYIFLALIPGIISFILSNNKLIRRVYLTYSVIASTIILSIVFSYNFFVKYDLVKHLSIKQRDFVKLAEGGVYVFNDSVAAFTEYENKNDLIPVGNSSKYYRFVEGSDYQYWKRKSDFKDTVYVKNSSDTTRFKLKYILVPSGSLLSNKIIDSDLWSVVSYLPVGIANTLFRPFVWEQKNALYFVPSVESSFLIVLLLLAVFFFKKRGSNINLILFSLLFSSLLVTIIGITTPVLGAIVRYKIPLLPFLFISIYLLIDKERITPLIPKFILNSIERLKEFIFSK
ncbi:MAG: hypothetical protein J0M08_09425 [Bacteroidetes bacterium]|nr:hypothetical protein [Bacteroidota bacterium]